MNIKKILFYVLAFLMGGCVPSMHPLYTDEDVVFEEKLLGNWSDGDTVWQFEKGKDPNSYKLTVTMDKQASDFNAHLTKISEFLFLDVYPGEIEIKANDYYKSHLLAAHSFLKIDTTEPNLAMRMMNPEKFDEFIKSNPDAIKHEVVNDRIVLTASTSELRAFMEEHANDERIFGDASDLHRVIASEPNEPNVTDANS